MEHPFPVAEHHLLLSPHLDDALFSASELVCAVDPEVWTVFAGVPTSPTATEWDRRCGYDDAQALMRDRRAEDVEAFASVGVTTHQLDALERAYVTPSVRAKDIESVTHSVDVWVADHPRAVIWLPIGAGGQMPEGLVERTRSMLSRFRGDQTAQVPASSPPAAAAHTCVPVQSSSPSQLRRLAQQVLHRLYVRRRRRAQRRGMLANEDHLVLRDLVVERYRSDPGVRIAFYEELPYLWSRRGDEQAATTSTRLGVRLESADVPVDRARKARLLAHYRTQLVVMDPVQRRLEQADTLPVTERYWWAEPR
ncbi:hypothetical protein [Aestuariimicrobium ganziense]|uniref:hypothetical protein n=1 Tax=Aestuariimicrobium ganziense TaxID=2773677 RepID=UPI00194254C0|nr:hypothetical protein [Aestuariimicrobium ganziense]